MNEFDKIDVIEIIGLFVVCVVKNLGVKIIVVVIELGYIVKMILKYCLDVDILVVIFDECIKCGLMLNWGVYLIVVEKLLIIDEMFELVVKKVVELGFVLEGDLILIIVGVLVGECGIINVMKI